MRAYAVRFVALGGLVLALLSGLAVGGPRRRRDADRAAAQPDSTGIPFK